MTKDLSKNFKKGELVIFNGEIYDIKYKFNDDVLVLLDKKYNFEFPVSYKNVIPYSPLMEALI